MPTKSIVKASTKKVAKANHKRTGSKNNFCSTVAIIEKGLKFPNMSRKPKYAPLFVFPSFDKCDSLLYFPTSLARHLNSGDFVGLAKLFNSHVRKTCDIDFACCIQKPSPLGLVRLFEFMDQLHPDSMMCCHTTKVVENQILSTLYLKFTDCKVIFDSVCGAVKDPMFKSMFSGNRADCLKERLELHTRPEAEREKICAVLETDQDFVVYLKIEMSMTVDNLTRKAVAMKFTSQFTSLNALNFTF